MAGGGSSCGSRGGASGGMLGSDGSCGWLISGFGCVTGASSGSLGHGGVVFHLVRILSCKLQDGNIYLTPEIENCFIW